MHARGRYSRVQQSESSSSRGSSRRRDDQRDYEFDDWGTSSHIARPENAGGATRAGSDVCDRVEISTFLSTDAGCTGDENPTGTLAYWYDFRKHRIRTLCIFRTARSDVYALECSSKRRNITMYYIFSQKRKSYQCASIPEGFSSPLQRAVASLTLAPPLVFCLLQI